MARSGSNDWHFMGDSLDDISDGYRRKTINTSALSFLFISSVVVLVLIGAVSVYSASINFTDGTFTRQLVYIGVGAAVFALVAVLPLFLLRALSLALVVLDLGYNIFCIVNNPLFVQNEVSATLIFVVTLLYYSVFSAKRENTVKSFKDVFLPVVIAILFTAILSISSDFFTVALYIVCAVVSFGLCTVNFTAALMLLLFVSVPAVCLVFSDPNRIETLLNYVVPGFDKNGLSSAVQLRRQCISSGSITGKGLAMGHFKVSAIGDISAKNILCNICEETGLLGACGLFAAYCLFAICSWIGSYVTREDGFLKSNIINCMSMLVVFQALLNVATVLGFIPENNVSLPLISAGPQVSVVLFECGCIYRCLLKEREKAQSASTDLETVEEEQPL